jgi:prepilin-type N-terminal cleavage/methylation domain-containing protein
MKTFRSRRHRGFTLVEIMVVMATIVLLASIAVPGFLRARKRSQAGRIMTDLRLIDSAVDQYAIENDKKTGDPVNTADWTAFMKRGSTLYTTGKDLFGNGYGPQSVDTLPKASAAAWNSLSDVATSEFWSPFGHY